MKNKNLKKPAVFFGITIFAFNFFLNSTSFGQDPGIESGSPDDVLNSETADHEAEEAGGDCACVISIRRGHVITFVNISELAKKRETIKMLEDCEAAADPCEGECVYAEKVPHEGWQIKTGKCKDWESIELAPHDRASVMGQNDHTIQVTYDAISFHPNPATNTITIDSPKTVNTLIYSIAGELLVETEDKKIDVNGLNAGSYVIIMNDGVSISREQLVIR